MNQSAGAPEVLDSPEALRAARRLRAWQLALEALVAAGLAAALGLTGGRAPWALPAIGLAAVATAAARARAARRALDVFGPCRVVLHRSGLSVAVEPATWHARDWPLNVGAPAWPVPLSSDRASRSWRWDSCNSWRRPWAARRRRRRPSRATRSSSRSPS
ncbi:MAG: hypothetical protein U0599_25315 [Vicinamibacteria bacterium]